MKTMRTPAIIATATAADLVELNDFAVNTVRAFAADRGLNANDLVSSFAPLAHLARKGGDIEFRKFLRAHRPASCPPRVPRTIRSAIFAIFASRAAQYRLD